MNSNGNRGRGRGFAGMSAEKQRSIASKGGRAAHRKGTAHEFDSEEGRRAGQKGGRARARNRNNQSGSNNNSSL
jgi:general stress protein YciG